MYHFRLNIPVAVAAMTLTILVGTALVGCRDYTTVDETTPATTTVTTTEDPAEDAAQAHKLWERKATLNDGREVTCLTMSTTALSCDWAGATYPAPEEPAQ